MKSNHLTCPGFQFSGISAGIKKDNLKDLGLIYSKETATISGLFTKNVVQAAPVLLDKKRIPKAKARAVIVNSGNANCCTGDQGVADAYAMTSFIANALQIDENQVFAASTGVIGQHLKIDPIKTSIPKLIESLSDNHLEDFARAIMTTDTIPKTSGITVQVDDKSFHICATAKGAGMIRPDMATLLNFVCTDIQADQQTLHDCFAKAINSSMNVITIDGDTSTNDTALILANGMSGLSLTDSKTRNFFQQALNSIQLELAKALVKDGEGANKLVEIVVKRANSSADAQKIADTVAHSNLVKTAIFGEDANWGRILAACGRAGVAFNPDDLVIQFNDISIFENGIYCGEQAEEQVSNILKDDEYRIIIDMKTGVHAHSVYTCDFSYDYIRINADYRT
ncbi:MAG: Arginine biosynthesis bifunctional protein ArgJ [Candidatus Magnetoglobus multicellularis str. Araruama]|uniref:Arginine biosynthesis bifunctional protein ArgJ n=1 Tax=Candidatus Magnetoglobus multicellularis str. Araruama TaxID=890399 RepID=A0A1V1PF69_9BACT|nr:MAG: Arginine biosynthesis bifunctional protein ArgJ [Candidatus Magnetoglobus multicellularis str. Araruama]